MANDLKEAQLLAYLTAFCVVTDRAELAMALRAAYLAMHRKIRSVRVTRQCGAYSKSRTWIPLCSAPS